MDIDKPLDELIPKRQPKTRGTATGPRQSRERAAPTPYARPPVRSTDEAWVHDMSGGGGPRRGAGGRAPIANVAGTGAGFTGVSPRIEIVGLHYEVTPSDLKGIFSKAGTIVQGPTIRYDRSGRSRGEATVEFASYQQAKTAINMFDGAMTKGVTFQDPALHHTDTSEGQTISIRLLPPVVARAAPAAARGAPAGGSLLSRISGGNAAPAAGPRGGGAPRGRGVGGRGRGAPAARGGRKAPANSGDLDKELDSFMGQSTTMFYPHQPPASSTSKAHHHPDGSANGGPNGWVGGGRHPFQPGGGGSGGTGNGMPMPNPGFGGLASHFQHHGPPHLTHGHGPHHPSLGSAGPGGMHLVQQNSGGMGMGVGPGGYGMGMFGAGGQGQASPPKAEQIPMTPIWQQQLAVAEASRNASSPHHRARAAAMASRNKASSAVQIKPDATGPDAQSSHRKNHSLQVTGVATNGDRGHTPDFLSDGLSTPGMSNVDPANPSTAPAPVDDEDEKPSEPWHGMDLGGIKLRNLSSALFTFTHVTELFINHNALTSLPPSISSMRQLKILDVTGNELSSLPPELGTLSKLKELMLFDNHLTTLPPELGTLYQLEFLGIAGNPMDERYEKMVANGGATALIQHLRDSCPVGPGPPQREWIEIAPDVSSPTSGQQESFTVLTYNILCHTFAPGSSYSYTPGWALDWQYRKQTILNEIVNASADVVCLQEIDCEQYADFFYPELKEHGYEGSHYPRTRARTMSPEEAKVVDGCATFWKSDRFNLIETQVVEFNQIALRRDELRSDDMFNRVMSRDNIAVVASLEFQASGARLMVANSHIYWDHRYRDVKLVQIGMLMGELEKIVDRFAALPAKLSADPEYNNGRVPTYDRAEHGRDIPLILCVDLNSLAGSAVYDYLSTGRIEPGHEDFMSHSYGTYTAKGLQHHLGLQSACASMGEMKMTNFTPTFDATIDYIFYTPRNIKVTSVLGDVDRAYLDKAVGFPNAHFPSDHIPVFAQFRILGRKGR
ncbi:Endonuclease/exonuclease/phosphatase [Naematelia encephala]|uniref:CCR4-Not complex 3'-5'-exoribonuclease subunit Ccr4 n=1 Tax=Naematelia encephala TaxID=71784 RepID=A0A1Y2BAW0_9TREE|nr:Endonuclease/exonuclease/phosphatase [Naematelia encephala]